MTARKLWDIDEPPVVVVVGSRDRTADLASAIDDATEFRVERVEELAAGVDRLQGRPCVECLWIAGEGATPVDGKGTDAELAEREDDEIEAIERATEVDPEAVVVYAPAAGDEHLAARATAAGASEYVATATDPAEAVGRVETAVERAIATRHDAWKRSALDAMVEEFDVNLFGKDEEARHVIFPQDVTTDDGRSLFGRTDPDAFQSSDEALSEAYQDDLDVIRTGKRVEGKIERYSEFQRGWQRTTKVPWRPPHEVPGLVGVTLDVSDWKNRERELLQRIGHLQRIPKYLTHDLRNPIAIAQGYLGLAREGDEEALDTVEDALGRLSRRLSEFHDFVDVAIGEDPAREPLELAPLLRDVWEHVSLPGTDLELQVPATARIVADEEQLRPLVENLFRNAVDHAGPRVTVTVELHDDGFSVSDDGPGLPVTDADLFEAGTATETDNHGIGLAIVEEVATLHSWRIETGESDSGGARFRFRDAEVVDAPLDATPVGEPLTLSGSTDVGDVDRPGSATFGPDSVKVVGAGENVWAKINQFHFASVEVEGDVRLTARVASMSVANQYSKAGLLVRDGLAEDDAYAGICRLADSYPELLWRAATGDLGESSQSDGVDPGTNWFRVERVGDTVVSSISTDGETWTPVQRRTIALEDPIEVGLFACSAEGGTTIEARFEDVEIRRLEE